MIKGFKEIDPVYLASDAAAVTAAAIANWNTAFGWGDGGTGHNLLSTKHSDVASAVSPVLGDMIVGDATPKWAKLAGNTPGDDVHNWRTILILILSKAER